MAPGDARQLFREGRYGGPTAAISSGYLQANLVILPAHVADDFELFCRQNSRPCPLLERLPEGCPESSLAAGSDLRFDLPRYRIFTRTRDGVDWTEQEDIEGCWRPDSVAFMLGCSVSFEAALSAHGLTPRHVEEGRNVPMYRTNRDTIKVGAFGGPLVVSMRPIARDRVAEVIALTEPFQAAHGAPIHVGDPSELGIGSLSKPDFGDAVTIHENEEPVFWACGVSSQEAVQGALRHGVIDRVMTHSPGHMVLCDLMIDPDIEIWS
jgi:uncharacterized protein YcsI (UPF0317 family)